MAGKLATAVFILCLGYVGQAHAGYKNDYAAWKDMDRYGRYTYVMALFDASQNNGFVGEDAYVSALRTGLSDCALGLHLRSNMIEEAMTRHYETHTRDWGLPPAVVFQVVTREICLDYINTARQNVSLPPWKSNTGSITGGTGQ